MSETSTLRVAGTALVATAGGVPLALASTGHGRVVTAFAAVMLGVLDAVASLASE